MHFARPARAQWRRRDVVLALLAAALPFHFRQRCEFDGFRNGLQKRGDRGGFLLRETERRHLCLRSVVPWVMNLRGHLGETQTGGDVRQVGAGVARGIVRSLVAAIAAVPVEQSAAGADSPQFRGSTVKEETRRNRLQREALGGPEELQARGFSRAAIAHPDLAESGTKFNRLATGPSCHGLLCTQNGFTVDVDGQVASEVRMEPIRCAFLDEQRPRPLRGEAARRQSLVGRCTTPVEGDHRIHALDRALSGSVRCAQARLEFVLRHSRRNGHNRHSQQQAGESQS